MPALIRAELSASGWAALKFPFNRKLVDTLKSVPGSRWDPTLKVWSVSKHGLAVLAPMIEREGLGKLDVIEHAYDVPPFFTTSLKTLRPYQLLGAHRLVSNAGFLLTMDPRTGKTPTAAAALSAVLASGRVERAFVFYPASVMEEWQRQLKEWIGATLVVVSGSGDISPEAVRKLAAVPYLLLGCHYEILGTKGSEEQRTGIFALADAGPFAIVADEVHMAKNRKAARTEVLLGLAAHKNCVHRWGLTGTPMRNRPRDLWAAFQFAIPESMGKGYWSYAKRYAAAFEGAYGWDDSGSSNEEELAARLKAISFRVTRADCADFLPKSDRKVVLCSMGTAAMQKYKALERTVGPAAIKGLGAGEPVPATLDALKLLATETVKSKLGALVDRLQYHAVERGVKVLVFANFHESLKMAWDTLEPADTAAKKPLGDVPVFCAGGWMLPDKRKAVRDRWKACPGAAVLLVNTLSSGIGIDLADADTSIFLELCWVPADFVQAEARTQDVHLGKRTTPPLYEYLLARFTIDEDMGVALVNKVNAIEAVVGGDEELRGMAAAIKGSGAVASSSLALNKADPEAVNAALLKLQARLLSGSKGNAQAILAADVGDAFSDEEEENEEGAGDDAPE